MSQEDFAVVSGDLEIMIVWDEDHFTGREYWFILSHQSLSFRRAFGGTGKVSRGVLVEISSRQAGISALSHNLCNQCGQRGEGLGKDVSTLVLSTHAT